MEQEPNQNPKEGKDAESQDSSATDGQEKDSSVKTPEDRATTLEKELLYLKAEFENFRKRILREQENAVKFANERFIRELIPLVGLFDRALGAAGPLKDTQEKKSEIQNFILGIEMTHRELVQALERAGVELVGKKGEKFNPERHEAISQVEAPQSSPETVAEVLERGAQLNGRLIQPAKVVVTKPKS